MTDELHPYVEWIAREARRPVSMDPAARERVMRAVRAAERPSSRVAERPSFWRRLSAPSFTLSPIASFALAAGLVAIGVFAGARSNFRDDPQGVGRSPIVAVQPQLPVSRDTVVRFVVVAPQAAKVSLVGDFNGWDVKATPMTRAANGGLWTVNLPLSEGRHVYSFVVDSAWVTNPEAPQAPDDGFGHASSVVLVRRGSVL